MGRIICDSCGSKVKDTEEFCPYCKSALDRVVNISDIESRIKEELGSKVDADELKVHIQKAIEEDAKEQQKRKQSYAAAQDWFKYVLIFGIVGYIIGQLFIGRHEGYHKKVRQSNMNNGLCFHLVFAAAIIIVVYMKK